MIESEEFVANEYVAACWWVTCNPKRLQDLVNAHEDCKGYSVRVGESEPVLTKGSELGSLVIGDNWYYANINGKETHHPVDSQDRTSSEHPNASA